MTQQIFEKRIWCSNCDSLIGVIKTKLDGTLINPEDIPKYITIKKNNPEGRDIHVCEDCTNYFKDLIRECLIDMKIKYVEKEK